MVSAYISVSNLLTPRYPKLQPVLCYLKQNMPDPSHGRPCAYLRQRKV